MAFHALANGCKVELAPIVSGFFEPAPGLDICGRPLNLGLHKLSGTGVRWRSKQQHHYGIQIVLRRPLQGD